MQLEEPALVNGVSQQAVLVDNVRQVVKVFWKEFEENFLYKKVSIKVLDFKKVVGLKKVQESSIVPLFYSFI